MLNHLLIAPRVLAGFLLYFLLSATAQAATYTVERLDDDNDPGSLRWAINQANANSGVADTIVFDVSGTITLLSTLPTITDAAGLIIDGAGQTITVSGGGTVQVMVVSSRAQLTLDHLTVADGTASESGGINNVGGTVIVRNSTFRNNSAEGGGGIYNQNNGTVIVVNSTFSSNFGYGVGGILNNGGTLTVINSTFSDNIGGGIFSNNILNLSNTILANSVSGNDCINSSGTINATGVNLIEDGSCEISNFPDNTDPMLDSLADNDGPTYTMALLAGSLAIDAANNTICAAAPVNNLDQRGAIRPAGSSCDIGAFEYGAVFPTPTVSATAIPTLSEWMLMLLGVLTGGLGWWRWPPKRSA